MRILELSRDIRRDKYLLWLRAYGLKVAKLQQKLAIAKARRESVE